MSDLAELGKTFQIVLRGFMDTGQAPHFTDIAKDLGVSPEVGRQRLHELIDLKIPGCEFYAKTSLVALFAPFSNVPTHHKITIDGEQKWFGQ